MARVCCILYAELFENWLCSHLQTNVSHYTDRTSGLVLAYKFSIQGVLGSIPIIANNLENKNNKKYMSVLGQPITGSESTVKSSILCIKYTSMDNSKHNCGAKLYSFMLYKLHLNWMTARWMGGETITDHGQPTAHMCTVSPSWLNDHTFTVYLFIWAITMCCGVQCAIAIITSEAALVPALWYGHFTSILHISVTVS